VDNGGAIPGSVISMANTENSDPYQDFCRDNGISKHPARMPIGLATFFVKYLTDPGDLVLDPFGGSNTTGAAAEMLGRQWISVEADAEYVHGSSGRFSKAKGGIRSQSDELDAALAPALLVPVAQSELELVSATSRPA